MKSQVRENIWKNKKEKSKDYYDENADKSISKQATKFCCETKNAKMNFLKFGTAQIRGFSNFVYVLNFGITAGVVNKFPLIITQYLNCS